MASLRRKKPVRRHAIAQTRDAGRCRRLGFVQKTFAATDSSPGCVVGGSIVL